jgi:ubiquinone/menaquinone biosynthesis C-methylase UbiE/uncharacterized protein YbaR (Trm112 family)
MSWPWIALILAGLVVLAALVYWQLIVAEGTYLGPRVVAWTYDLVSGRYDAIKRFRPRDESWFVAAPLLGALLGVEQPLVLDVATGTGRLPLALLRERFRGHVAGLDLSRGMLREARRRLRAYDEQVTLIWQDAAHLPFDDGVFDAVTCLESLEFMSRPLEVLSEMVRVLAPGGVLLVSNRVGREARLLPGRTISRPAFQRVLDDQPLSDFQVRPWQSNYDLAIARKVGERQVGTRRDVDPISLLRCPACGGRLQRGAGGLSCPACPRAYRVDEGVVHLANHERRGTR